MAADACKAFCKFCKCDIKAKYQDLKQHTKSKKHFKARPFTTRALDSFMTVKSFKTAELEASISTFLGCHSAISDCDHLVDICKRNLPTNKTVSEMKMHQTKCTRIIRNTLCEPFKTDLRQDIGDGRFSILIDESTDITVHKLLDISIIYYSMSKKKIVLTYLELTACDAEHIVIAFNNVLSSHKLSLKNLAAIRTDNASVMIGINKGVHAQLRAEIPSLILIKCVCHSIQLAVSQASADSLH